MPHIRLVRSVCRSPRRCNACPWVIDEFDALYSPTVGGVALAHYCQRRCAEISTRAPLEVAYVA